MDIPDYYQSPFHTRYASKEMNQIFSLQQRYKTWRAIWTALAQVQKDLGIPITEDQINELSAHIDTTDLAAADAYEKDLQHDVMAHIRAYGDQCPLAKPIIHLGATSCLITDNADLIIMREALKIIKEKALIFIKHLAHLAERHKGLACLSYTHLQPALPTTMGKRIALWLQDFLWDFQDLSNRLDRLKFLGAKGATGTQDSFLTLFQGDHEKVKQLDNRLAKVFGFSEVLPVSGQTYARKIDLQILDILSGFAVSSHKMATDLRLLAHLNEIEEPFLSHQVGSSAMPYKQNPIIAERICSLARFLMALRENPCYTAATQWLERSLDDSANRRLSIPEAFLALDSILKLLNEMTPNLGFCFKQIKKNLENELPFLATEKILMRGVKKGEDRQALHAKLQKHSFFIRQKMKEEGEKNDLLERIGDDPLIPFERKELNDMIANENFVGRSVQQVEEFLKDHVSKVLNDLH